MHRYQLPQPTRSQPAPIAGDAEDEIGGEALDADDTDDADEKKTGGGGGGDTDAAGAHHAPPAKSAGAGVGDTDAERDSASCSAANDERPVPRPKARRGCGAHSAAANCIVGNGVAVRDVEADEHVEVECVSMQSNDMTGCGAQI